MNRQRTSRGRRFDGNPRGGRGGRIRYMRVDPKMLVRKAVGTAEIEYQAQHRFDEFGLNKIIVENVSAKGYTVPTPVQDRVIPLVMQSRDVVGLAQTGTGKTAAFLLPIIQRIVTAERAKAIVIAPTRELARQIIEEGRSFARGVRCYFTEVIGGVNIQRQIRDLRRNPQVVVGTPGRIKDLVERRELRLGEYQTVVLDEVDRMLDMGFVHDVSLIVDQLPRERNSLFFSATMTDKAREVARKFLHNPELVEVVKQNASGLVDQDVVYTGGRNKAELLHELLLRPGFDRVLVFGRSKHGMERLARDFVSRGFAATAIHGNKSQSQRQRALREFKTGQVKVLMATDVAARGIDVDNITHVINYELPETYDDYIHRIGRTGRAGRVGSALTFVE